VNPKGRYFNMHAREEHFERLPLEHVLSFKIGGVGFSNGFCYFHFGTFAILLLSFWDFRFLLLSFWDFRYSGTFKVVLLLSLLFFGDFIFLIDQG